MSLSTMQEIFILLEDEKEVPFYRLKRWGTPAKGALAKLKSLKYIDKIIADSETYYKITEEGAAYLDSILGLLKQRDQWDRQWRLIMFEIPETNRALRDKLRRELISLGLGLLQSSVWVTPQNLQKEITEIDERLSLGTQLKYFEVNSNPSIDKQIMDKAWNIPEIMDDLAKFIKDAEWSLKAMGKGNGDRYNAKKLIFEYATILKKGPLLPEEFLDKSEVRKTAHEIYLKLRKYAV